jgi:prolyl-tRNA editing enzyme YbaK/EbsC (Cys-tRNA(Pro) deacylase)
LLLKGTDLLDLNKLKSKIGKSSIASIDEVFVIAGVELGAVRPLIVGIPVLIDSRVFKLELLNFSSRNKPYGVEIKSNDLFKVLDYELVDLAKKDAINLSKTSHL